MSLTSDAIYLGALGVVIYSNRAYLYGHYLNWRARRIARAAPRSTRRAVEREVRARLAREKKPR